MVLAVTMMAMTVSMSLTMTTAVSTFGQFALLKTR